LAIRTASNREFCVLTRIWSELGLIDDPRERRAAYRVAYRQLRKRRGVYTFGVMAMWMILANVLLRVTLASARRVLHIDALPGAFDAGLASAFGSFLGSLAALWSYRAALRPFLHQELAARGFIVCAKCGYHLKGKHRPLLVAILLSWGVAFFEYCLQVPANRIGYQVLTLGQLKVIQEVITMSVFAVFAVVYMKERLSWDYLWAGLCLVGAAYFMFRGVRA
jgi:uncharacterized protein (DUF486 family)